MLACTCSACFPLFILCAFPCLTQGRPVREADIEAVELVEGMLDAVPLYTFVQRHGQIFPGPVRPILPGVIEAMPCCLFSSFWFVRH